MTPRILDKVTMIEIDDRLVWITTPWLRDEHGDRPAIPFEAIRPTVTPAKEKPDHVRPAR